jgi:hypothetical protein
VAPPPRRPLSLAHSASLPAREHACPWPVARGPRPAAPGSSSDIAQNSDGLLLPLPGQPWYIPALTQAPIAVPRPAAVTNTFDRALTRFHS